MSEPHDTLTESDADADAESDAEAEASFAETIVSVLPDEPTVDDTLVPHFSDRDPAVRVEETLPEVSEGEQRYETLRELGQGGMGEVHLCLDHQIGRRVAMKTLRTHSRADGARRRFLREARIQGQLEHPSVVPVYDLGVDAPRGLYFTMKRIRGVTLEDLLDHLVDGVPEARAKWTRRRLLHAFAQVCLSIDYAHERGILHRDLKPANIMLGDFGEVYVLDWGLASGDAAHDPQAIEHGGTVEVPAPGLTSAGVISGTPGYMSPEQASAAPAQYAPTTDVYGLGAMLFELLTYEALHPGRTVIDRFETTLRGTERRPSVRAPHAEVPPELDEIVVRATETDPADRFASARDLHDALVQYLDGEQDEERRRSLAQDLAEQARGAAETALESDDDVAPRREAMQRVGRALALDPDNRSAIETLVRLVTTPPRTLPKEVVDEQAKTAGARMRAVARAAVWAYASLILYLPFLFGSGITRAEPVIALYLGAVVAAGVSYWVSTQERLEVWAVLIAMAASNLAFGATAAFFGPLFLTPSLVASNTTAYAVYLNGWPRWIAVATGVAIVAGTMGLGLAGALPGGYEISEAGMLIRPGALGLSPIATYLFLAVSAIGNVLTGTLVLSQLRSDLGEAERRMHMHVWQVRAMIPGPVEGVHRAVSG